MSEAQQENNSSQDQELEKIIDLESKWLTDQNIWRFEIGYKIFLGLIVLIVMINILLPLYLRRDPSYSVTKTGCFGIDINDACVGIAKYKRELRRDI